MTGSEVLKILKKHGSNVVRINGSHHIISNGTVKFPVPVHGKKDIKIGTF